MGERAGGRETRDRRRLASRRVPLVLALPFAPPFWPTENHPRASPSDPVYGGGEPTWGAPRIHGELLKLGFEISESTVSRYLAQGDSPRDSGQRWLTFLKSHREALAAMDFFTVPTATFRVLYCFFVIAHGRRKILHFNVTEHPTGSWKPLEGFSAFRIFIRRCATR